MNTGLLLEHEEYYINNLSEQKGSRIQESGWMCAKVQDSQNYSTRKKSASTWTWTRQFITEKKTNVEKGNEKKAHFWFLV
jgi:hypothetical protein